MGILNREQIDAMGFASVGNNTFLSDKASYYNCKNITIGNDVRIDDFCILSAGVGGIRIGNYIHIAAYSSLIGAGEIIISDFANISSRVAIYSSNDDYSGQSMTNPMVAAEFTDVTSSPVTVGRHVIIGSGVIVLPGSILEDGVAVGALSMVSSFCLEFGIYAGVPAKRIKDRRKDLLEVENRFFSAVK